MFEHRFIRFQYHHERKIFEPIVFNANLPFNLITETLSDGIHLNTDNANKNYEVQKLRYGICDILIPIDNLPTLLVKEVLNPFYLFQVRNNTFLYSLDLLFLMVVLGVVLLLRRLPVVPFDRFPCDCFVGADFKLEDHSKAGSLYMYCESHQKWAQRQTHSGD